MSTILVTGASGFIGSHLCMRLIAEGHQVHGVSRTCRSSQEPDDAIQWWLTDLCDYDAVRVLLKSVHPDIVFHLSSRVTGSRELCEVAPVFQANLMSTVHVLTSAVDAGSARVVLAGSSEEPQRLDCATPCSPYAVAKWSSTAYAGMFRTLFHKSVVVPRIFMTYGPGQQDVHKVIPYTIVSMLRGERPKLSSGTRLVDWVYIDDVVEGLMKAAFAPQMEECTFDLGSGSLTSIRAVVEQIAEIVGNGVEPDFGAVPDRPLEQERLADVTFMQRAFGWTPNTSLPQGLEETVKWYRHLCNTGLYVASFISVVIGQMWFDYFPDQELSWLQG